MINSMTGFGRAQKNSGSRDITIEIKAVNHRYFEYYSRLPRAYSYLDEKIKAYLQKEIKRGKVEVSVTVITVESGTSIQINEELALSYIEALRKLAANTGIKDDLSLSSISRFNDIFVLQKLTEEEEQIWLEFEAVLAEALGKFLEMRRTEGENLKTDILERLVVIEENTVLVEERSPQRVEEYRQRLFGKISEVLQNTQIDEQRILTEAAIYAEKIAVDEETTRLRSHLMQFKSILGEKDAVGRKLDFLVQEINREINTIGSKAQDSATANIVIALKSEVEKIREQIQNIE